MNILQLSIRLIWKRKYTYLLLMFQMIVSTIIFVSLVGKMQNIVDSRNVANIFNSENSLYFTPYTYYDTNEFDINEVLKKDCNYRIGKVFNLNFKTEHSESVFAYGYNDTIIDYTNIELVKGEWFNKDKQYKYIPIISVGQKYPVGHIISLQTLQNNKSFNCQVIGTIKENEYITTFMSGGSKGNASLENIVSNANADFIVPFNCNQYLSFGENDMEFYNNNYGNIIIYEKSDELKICSKLSQFGEVSKIEEMIENFRNDNRDYFLSNGIVLIIFTMLCIAGIGGINSMLNIENKRRFSLYFMCGMTSKMCGLVEGLRSGVVVITSYIISICIFKYTNCVNLFPPNLYSINSETFFYIMIYMAIIYAITSVAFIMKYKKQNLIEIYRENI